MLGQGPWPVVGGVVAEDPVPDEPVPEDGVVVELAADCEALGVVVVVEVAAPDARVPTPSPSPRVPAATPATTAIF